MKKLKQIIIEFFNTYIVEDLTGLVIVRELSNHHNVIKYYDSVFVPRVGDYIFLGSEDKSYRVEKVAFTTTGSIANIYINL